MDLLYEKTFQDYLDSFMRRRWQFIWSAGLILILAVLAAALLPPSYRSTATVLIEEPEVPRELVRSTITSFADQRLQVITQRVLTTRNLIDIVERYDLYPAERRKSPIHQIVAGLREDIAMEMVSADVVDPRSGHPTQATIAFTLSFAYEKPRMAQQVVNELVSLYLSENLRERREKAADTTQFLAAEAARLAEHVNGLERDLAEFKKKHAGALPDQRELNLRQLQRNELEAVEMEGRLRALEERRIFLEGELVQIEPYGSYQVAGETIFSPSDQLKMLRTRFISLSGAYGPSHPDVMRTKREIEALEREVGGPFDTDELQRHLSQLQSRLSTAREKYGEAHPDIANLKRQVRSAEEALEDAKKPGAGRAAAAPDNPAYIQLGAQLQAVESEIESLKARKLSLDGSVKSVEDRILLSPEVEREYLQLKRDHENAYAQYQEVKSKQLEAQLAESLESESKSEQFSLIEPPLAPTEPESPNRPAILAIGLVAALAAGLGMVLLLDGMDQGVYGPRQLAAVAGAPPLVIIPCMVTPDARRRGRVWRFVAAGGVILAAAAGLLLVHLSVMPLDVLWFRLVWEFGS